MQQKQKVPVECHKCGYKFQTVSQLMWVTCPSCQFKTLRIKEEIVGS